MNYDLENQDSNLEKIKNDIRIVSVDDSVIILKTLETLLSDRYIFKGFNKGSRALKFLEAKGADLIILDIEMPEMSGFEVLKKLRENEKTADIPVILATGNANEDIFYENIDFKGTFYIQKPIEPDVLLENIDKILNDF